MSFAFFVKKLEDIYKMLLHLTRIITKIALAVILAICAGYASHGAAAIKIKAGDEEAARNYMIVSAVLGWVFVVVTVLSFVAMVVFAEEIAVSRWLRLAEHSVIYMLIGGLFIVGILMAVAAQEVRNGPSYGSNKSVFKYASTAAIIGIVSSVATTLIFGGIHLYDNYKRKNDGGSSTYDVNPLLGEASDALFSGIVNKYV